MPKQSKSRGGCAFCKDKRVKCDETKPACSRCVRLDLDCPGYQKPLKWSTKYALVNFVPPSEQTQRKQLSPRKEDSPKRNTRRSPILHDTPKYKGDFTTCPPSSLGAITSWPSNADLDTLLFEAADPLSGTSFLDTSIQQYPPGDQFPALDWQDILTQTSDTDLQLIEGLLKDPIQDILLESSLVMDSQHESQTLLAPNSRFSISAEPMDTTTLSQVLNLHEIISSIPGSIHDQDSILTTYYFKEVAALCSCFDGHFNPFRTTLAQLWTSSALLSYTIRSMAAACLCDTMPKLRKVEKELRAQSIALLKQEITSETVGYTTALATIMLGQTASWHDTKDLGINLCKDARKLLRQFSQDKASQQPIKLPNDSFQFFNELMSYWDMLLSFVTDDLSEAELSPYKNIMPHTLPHPWTGVGYEVLEMTGHVGKLIYKEKRRKFALSSDPPSISNKEPPSIQLAKQLFDSLNAFQFPEKSHIFDPRDEQTSVDHLLAVAEAYRSTALVQLIHVFGHHLGSDRQQIISLDGIGHANGMSPYNSQSEIDHQTLQDRLRRYALDILNLLESIPLESRTRCVQPFLFVALSSEMSFPSNMHALNASSQTLDVMRARKFVASRLSIFQHLLPPRPARQKFALVQEVWRLLDEEENDQIYWMDVMLEKGWETVMG